MWRRSAPSSAEHLKHFDRVKAWRAALSSDFSDEEQIRSYLQLLESRPSVTKQETDEHKTTQRRQARKNDRSSRIALTKVTLAASKVSLPFNKKVC